MPAHNEERRIGRTLDMYRSACIDPDISFLIALDGSDDATAEIVRHFERLDPRIRMIELPKLGKGGAIMEAFRVCDGELIGFVDADGATLPSEVLSLAEIPAEVDGAIASRRHPGAVVPVPRPMTRRISSAIFAFFARRLFGLPYSDTQCGAKVLRRETVRQVLPYLSSRDFLFDVDLLVVARKLGLAIVEVPTIWVDQEDSRLRAGADGRRMAASALRLWFHHRVLPVHSSGSKKTSTESRESDAAA
jgi:glycosyltransferase involved in cell wall biosynthesis